MSLDRLDYYMLLGVDDDAPTPAIKRAFRKFARKYHPDRFAGQDRAKIEKAAEIYRRGSEAFQVLTDPDARAAYDAALERGRLRLSAEELDRAAKKDAAPAPEKKAQPIKSPQALAYFKKGVRAAHEGDWRAAWRFLKSACESEPGNPFLESRFHQVDRRLRGW